MVSTPQKKGGIIIHQEDTVIDLMEMYQNKLTLLIEDSDISKKNIELNLASDEEYKRHHIEKNIPEKIKNNMSLFEGFIAKNILSGAKILDIGCGTRKDIPPYFNNIVSTNYYFGLDPIKVNLEDRNYPFFCCGIEDLKKIQFKEKFDLALFSTSLDHIDNISSVFSILKGKIKNGNILIWVGLHDSNIVARSFGTHIFNQIFMGKNIVSWLARLVKILITNIYPLIIMFHKREKKLKLSLPLDDKHFHYFTYEKFLKMLSNHGHIKESILVPGTNSLFVNYMIK